MTLLLRSQCVRVMIWQEGRLTTNSRAALRSKSLACGRFLWGLAEGQVSNLPKQASAGSGDCGLELSQMSKYISIITVTIVATSSHQLLFS